MAFPKGYGYYRSCVLCPCKNDCDEGKHCKVFTPLKKKAQEAPVKSASADDAGVSPLVKLCLAIVAGIICSKILRRFL
ncbi:MAG: hypothetical protein IK038_02025 [Bacteroidaceae bacterium]|nr:hypothetical protein [Bacteroidaceae bacterium]